MNKTDIQSSHVSLEREGSLRNNQLCTKTEWPRRKTRNVILNSSVEPNDVLLILLTLRVSVMMQFVKAIPENGDCFNCHCRECSDLSAAKL
ncbi:hypothetical protein TNCV_590351 [Trichonephila clavipes]|nr:hypothetical protein TNCV_590351 [Trichonephila clavipes]